MHLDFPPAVDHRVTRHPVHSAVALVAATCLGVIAMSCQPSRPDPAAVKEEVRQAIDGSIGWAQNKDFDLLYRIFSADDLFIYHPDDASTVTSLAEFKQMGQDVWGNPAFKATGHEMRDLRINLSESGTVAWFSCYLDDFAEGAGREVGWENVRWTGVLELRDGQWTAVQMHFSFPTERMKPKAATEG